MYSAVRRPLAKEDLWSSERRPSIPKTLSLLKLIVYSIVFFDDVSFSIFVHVCVKMRLETLEFKKISRGDTQTP